MAELRNCTRCGGIFAMNIRDICPKCYRKEEDDFQTVYRFLTKRQNKEATIHEIVGATGVEEEAIIKFLKQNRLRASQFPKLVYPCEKCKSLISQDRLCSNCTEEIKSELKHYDELERITEERKKKESIYFTMNKKFDEKD